MRDGFGKGVGAESTLWGVHKYRMSKIWVQGGKIWVEQNRDFGDRPGGPVRPASRAGRGRLGAQNDFGRCSASRRARDLVVTPIGVVWIVLTRGGTFSGGSSGKKWIFHDKWV